MPTAGTVLAARPTAGAVLATAGAVLASAGSSLAGGLTLATRLRGGEVPGPSDCCLGRCIRAPLASRRSGRTGRRFGDGGSCIRRGRHLS